jgi:hypothetical protein
MVLTKSQKDELNRSILEYLLKHKYATTAEAFEAEAELSGADVPDADSGVGGAKKDLLEKKWTSVVKLKKQVM